MLVLGIACYGTFGRRVNDCISAVNRARRIWCVLPTVHQERVAICRGIDGWNDRLTKLVAGREVKIFSPGQECKQLLSGDQWADRNDPLGVVCLGLDRRDKTPLDGELELLLPIVNMRSVPNDEVPPQDHPKLPDTKEIATRWQIGDNLFIEHFCSTRTTYVGGTIRTIAGRIVYGTEDRELDEYRLVERMGDGKEVIHTVLRRRGEIGNYLKICVGNQQYILAPQPLIDQLITTPIPMAFMPNNVKPNPSMPSQSYQITVRVPGDADQTIVANRENREFTVQFTINGTRYEGRIRVHILSSDDASLPYQRASYISVELYGDYADEKVLLADLIEAPLTADYRFEIGGKAVQIFILPGNA